jgi:hypothetical protein
MSQVTPHYELGLVGSPYPFSDNFGLAGNGSAATVSRIKSDYITREELHLEMHNYKKKENPFIECCTTVISVILLLFTISSISTLFVQNKEQSARLDQYEKMLNDIMKNITGINDTHV